MKDHAVPVANHSAWSGAGLSEESKAPHCDEDFKERIMAIFSTTDIESFGIQS